MSQSSLLSNDALNNEEIAHVNTDRCIKLKDRRFVGFTLIVLIVSLSILIGFLSLGKHNNAIPTVQPVRIRIALPNSLTILLGNSRVIQVLFYSGYDDRTSQDYKTVTQREIIWSSDPQGVVTIDRYGRLETLTLGKTTIRAQSKSQPQIFAQQTIQIVNDRESKSIQKNIINYSGNPASLNQIMQKIVSFKTKQEALISKDVPDSIKNIIINPTIQPKRLIAQGNNIVWEIEDYADGSNRSYIKRINPDEANHRDRMMYLIGDRYLPGKGFSVLSIQDDQSLGLWAVNTDGEVSHIQMKNIDYRQKAKIMVQNTQKNVLRFGLASSSTLKNGTWVPSFTDNDGLWTALYAAGEFMRLASLKRKEYPQEQISMARNSALYSLKAILLISFISCRNITVDAKLRHFINTRDGQGEILSSQFLIKDHPFSVDQYVGSPVDGEGFFGIEAGKFINGKYHGGKYKYSFSPIFPESWSNNPNVEAATSKRTLNGFISRSFVIQPLEGIPNGFFFRHNRDGTQYVLNEANKLYDYGVNDHPTLNLGNMELPQILKDFLKINGVQYQKYDVLYKGDTSTDSTIGHLFIYKIAFDILDESNPQQNTLRQLIKESTVSYCTCLLNNGYSMVDATGQGTAWAKITRTFMMSDFQLEDSPLKSLQLLLSFKLCYYFTGDQSWQKEYQFLIQDQSFRYLDLVASVWEKWTYRAFNQDAKPLYHLYHLDDQVDYSQTEITRHIIETIHYSDEEEAFLSFYLAFQLQTNQTYLKLYRKGLEGWWHSPSRSENQLWYYIYQLAYPNQLKQDYYGNNILDVASWRLSRYPVDTRMTAAFVEGSRSDIIIQGNQRSYSTSKDPNHILQKRLHASASKYQEREISYKVAKDYNPMNIYEFKILPPDQCRIHKFNGATFQTVDDSSPNVMQPSTGYTLPYWMGVYHNMLTFE